MHSIAWQSAALTHTGKVRKLNEDALFEAPQRGVWAVADGMGGHHAGDVASRSVVDAMRRVDGGSLTELIDATRNQLSLVNAELFEQGRGGPARIIGSTVVVLLAHGRKLAVAWAGDSRAYRRAAGGNTLEALSQDHSRVTELIALGELTPELAESHPEANIITRAIGVAPQVEIDIRLYDVEPGDTLLLCSDGLSRYLTESEINQLLGLPSCTRSVEQLLQRALQSPARDNITAIVVRAIEDDTHTVLNVQGEQDHRAPDDDPTVLDTS